MCNDNTSNTFNSVRDKVNAMTDDQLANEMQTRWENDNYPAAPLSDEQESMIKSHIRSKTFFADENGTNQGRHSALIKYFIRAAAVLVPLLVLSTGWLLYDRMKNKPTLTVIETSSGEKTTVRLSDGSTVRLNYDTRLSYDPIAFQHGDRSMTIDGEAMFDVHKDSKHPFTVNAHRLRVTVLGTVFNLRSRADESHATVFLEEGEVKLTAAETGAQAMLRPIEKATLDYATNSIKVTSATKTDAATAWQRGELKFEDERLSLILSAIEGNFGVNFVNKSTSHMLNDRFSGTLPSDDLNEALEILAHTYNVDFEVKDKKINILRKHAIK